MVVCNAHPKVKPKIRAAIEDSCLGRRQKKLDDAMKELVEKAQQKYVAEVTKDDHWFNDPTMERYDKEPVKVSIRHYLIAALRRMIRRKQKELLA